MGLKCISCVRFGVQGSMAFIYAMSDMHNDMEAFERVMSVVDLDDPNSMLVLCGDYMPKYDDDFTMIHAIMELQEAYPEQVVALAGNHEHLFVETWLGSGSDYEKDPGFAWMRKLPYIYETDSQIFVHAGVDEEAGEWWKWGTPDEFFCMKFPWSTGPFLKDIIAGHVGTHTISGDPNFHDVYWDGESHYFLDGNTLETHIIPLLKYDVDRRRYSAITFDEEGNPLEHGIDGPC